MKFTEEEMEDGTTRIVMMGKSAISLTASLAVIGTAAYTLY